jgi:hypothetical protein
MNEKLVAEAINNLAKQFELNRTDSGSFISDKSVVEFGKYIQEHALAMREIAEALRGIAEAADKIAENLRPSQGEET